MKIHRVSAYDGSTKKNLEGSCKVSALVFIEFTMLFVNMIHGQSGVGNRKIDR